jgi:hypothetical protein
VVERRQSGWTCAQASALDLAEGVAGPDPDGVRLVLQETLAAWVEVRDATAEVVITGPEAAADCLSHKRLILHAFGERVEVLYAEFFDAVDRCDLAAMLGAQEQLQVASQRVEQLRIQAGGCFDLLPGMDQTVVLLESSLSEDTDDLAPIAAPLDDINTDLGASPIVADPVSPYE